MSEAEAEANESSERMVLPLVLLGLGFLLFLGYPAVSRVLGGRGRLGRQANTSFLLHSFSAFHTLRPVRLRRRQLYLANGGAERVAEVRRRGRHRRARGSAR